MAWGGIVGKSFSPDAFAQYIGTVDFGLWRPSFVVVHNTGAPDRATWDGWHRRTPPITDLRWAKNLERYYKGRGWSGCPHVFVTPAGLLVMNHLSRRGTHSPSWNSVSWGVETVGDFDRDHFSGSIKDNLVGVLAILHAAAGLQPIPFERGVRGLHFHKEDPNTEHKRCPGKNIVKADLIRNVQAEIQRRTGGEHPADEGANVGVVNVPQDDPLNLREEPSARSNVVMKLNKGARVMVLGRRSVGSTRWLNVRVAGKSGWAAARFIDIT
jgi:hypothetical protein